MMNYGRQSIPFLILFVLCFSCSNKSKTDLNDLNWLLGKWKLESEGSPTFENWKRTDENLLEGESFLVKDSQITFLEMLKIEKIDREIFYTATVAHNPDPVSFKLVKISSETVTFENPEHDFPQRISYWKNSDGTLSARISGRPEGAEEREIDFSYVPVE